MASHTAPDQNKVDKPPNTLTGWKDTPPKTVKPQ